SLVRRRHPEDLSKSLAESAPCQHLSFPGPAKVWIEAGWYFQLRLQHDAGRGGNDRWKALDAGDSPAAVDDEEGRGFLLRNLPRRVQHVVHAKLARRQVRGKSDGPLLVQGGSRAVVPDCGAARRA